MDSILDGKTIFETNGHKYVIKPWVDMQGQKKISHYCICPGGKKIRIQWIKKSVMTATDFSLWVSVGRPNSLRGHDEMNPDILNWIHLSQSKSLSLDVLKIKNHLKIIKKFQYVLNKTPEISDLNPDLADKKSIYTKEILTKEIQDLDEIKNLEFKQVPYSGYYDTGIMIENFSAYLTTIKDQVLSIHLGDDDSNLKSAPITPICLSLLKRDGWTSQMLHPIGLYRGAEFYSVFSK